ncbi:MAG: lipase family protein [Bacteroidota bacterium]
MTTTPQPNIGTLPMIFAHAAYNANPQSVLNQYPGFTNGWSVVWASDFTQPNYVFVGSNGTDYILAIRGSLLQFSKDAYVNWIKEDLKVFSQTQWTWFVPSSESSKYNPAAIAAGASTGLTTLQGLTQANSTDGTTLPDYLVETVFKNNANLIITGHSLGGNLSSVFAPWMQWYWNNQQGADAVYANMQVHTFAAPAAGSVEFADYYNNLFGGNAFRFYNTNDIVPTFPADIGTTADMFAGGPDANQISVTIDNHQITLHDFFEGVRVAVDLDMFKNGYIAYQQPNETEGAFPFTLPIDQSYVANTIDDWMEQAGNQHSGVNYLAYFLTLPQPLKPAQNS